jgi:hypothetical protein
MRAAFKEWAVVVDALGSGDQIIILRKGGIAEGRRGFQVEHAEFLLYPTFVHQQREAVLPPWRDRFDAQQKERSPNSGVTLDFFAQVVSWQRLESRDQAQSLKGQHIWQDDVIAKRFDWGKEKNIYLLAVRVFRLPLAMPTADLPNVRGCKSWIAVDQQIATEGATPVLSKEAFNVKLDRVNAALQTLHPDQIPAEQPEIG